MDSRFGIVAIGYSRPESLQRLLNGLKQVDYNGDYIDLIISIDNSGNEFVKKVAENFEWKYGEKIVLLHQEKLGLKRHVLKCGDLTEDYENIAVFEDDIFPCIGFYNYALQAIDYYKNDDRIAGISLYSHSINVNCQRPFYPIQDDNDIYFLQFAQSWGQIWSRKKWKKFKEWYNEKKEISLQNYDIPEFVKNWPETSWLKYHIAYLVDTNRYFVYPKVSLTTNFTDVGQHAKMPSTDYQVVLDNSVKKKYKFIKYTDEVLSYDSYFENELLYKNLNLEGLKKEEICVNLYTTKKINKKHKYLLSTEKKDLKIIKSYALKLRPHENNIIYNISGNNIFLYELCKKAKNKNFNKYNEDYKIKYDLKSLSLKKTLKILMFLVKFKFKLIK